MNFHRNRWSVLSRFAVVLLLAAGSLALISAEKPVWSIRDKAHYADANTVAFVRPGLEIAILGAEIREDGTIKTRVKFTDPKGLPLDRDGIFTPGSISASVIAATIPKGKTQYVAYTTRSQTSPITNQTAVQAGADSGGVWEKVGDGEYTYTFRTKAPAGHDRTATHTIGVYASRDLTEFELGTNLRSVEYNFVPDGSPVQVTRDVIRDVSCNRCHDRLTAHGTTGRESMSNCVLCHTPQTVDPDTGNSVDMMEMIHKIHRGADLPSVQAGEPYVIIGNRQSVHDFSEVVFPVLDDDSTRQCQVCHQSGTGAAQQDAWLTPTRASCGSCHDNVNFATGENHAGLPQVTDNQCKYCHIPEGELEFDLSIIGAHTTPRLSKELPGLVVDLVSATGAAGTAPTVTFTVKDKKGNNVEASKLDRLRLQLVGPTSDFPADPVAEDARQAQVSTDGLYTYTFKTTVPAGAKGSWAVFVEARQRVKLLPGTVREQEVRDLAFNDAVYFPVDGSPVEPRRTAVLRESCNDCHNDLNFHGGNRSNPQYCAACHRPGATAEGESIDFRVMTHKIHAGAELERPYVLGDHDYSGVHYPGRLNNCLGCHAQGAYHSPLEGKLLPVTDPKGWLNPVGPESAACLSCHDSLQAASHALANTSALGESCAACHGNERQFSVDKVHAE